jgi:7-keto-8-aminopelargonate synthetase-like enzyme
MQNSGQIASLDKIVRLKEKYHFRIILDESHSFGVLGNSGRGLAEYCGVPVLYSLSFSSVLGKSRKERKKSKKKEARVNQI